MKQESTKNSKKMLWLILAAVTLLAAVGIVAAVMLLKPPAQEQQQAVQQGDTILYWNMDRDFYMENSEMGLSTREASEDGLYHMRFVANGEMMELITADKKLVNSLDMLYVAVLQLDGDDIIDFTDPLDLGYTINKGVFIQKVDEKSIVANSSMAMNGMPLRIKITEKFKVHDGRETETNIDRKMVSTDLLPMDYVTVCFDASGDATDLFLAGRSPRTSLYWRAEQFYSSSQKSTTRVPDENGVYHIDFFCDGKRVTLPCKDKDVVTAIDKPGRLVCHFSLVLDDDGYIIETKASTLGLKALTGCEGATVQTVDGISFTAQTMTGKSAGDIFEGKITKDCKIYDVSKTARSEGRQGEQVDSLQVGDRVTVWTDTEGKPVLIYVTIRLTDAPAYFSMQRKYTAVDGVTQTSRKPDANGWYYVEMMKVGETTSRVYKTKDIDVVNTIDVPTNRTAALALDGDVILRAYEAECIYGYTPLGPRYVTGYISNVYSAMTYKAPESVVNGVVGPDCKVYDYSGTGEMGALTTLKEGDLIFVHRNPAEEAVEIMITKRAMGEDHLYWNLGRKYDSTNKVTTREPDAEGWYVFNVAYKGEQTTVKTKNKELATLMDSMTPGAMGLVVKNGVVQYAFDPIQTAGAVRVAFVSTVTKIDADGTVHAVTSTGIESTFVPSKDCKYYNTSAAHYSHKGEYTEGVQINDLITGYLDMYGEAKFVYIYGRDVDEIYWNSQRMYSSSKKETTRVPDAEGYYVFQLAVDGELRTLKTKNKDVATSVDSQASAFGLLTKDGIIYSVTGADRVVNVDKRACTDWNVIKIDGNKITVQYQKPGSKEYTGKTMDFELHKWHRAYDVSATAKNFGSKVALKLGDSVTIFVADNGQVLYTYVTAHNTRKAGQLGYCEHCKTEVYWISWNGGAITSGGHYYVAADLNKTSVVSIGAEASDFEVVLDLNGKKITTTGSRAFSVGLKEKMYILDSVGGGEIAATGATDPVKSSDYTGGVMNLYSGGKLYLYSGTLRHLNTDSKITNGGVVYANGAESAFTMYGGTLIGGKVVGASGVGGNVYAKSSAVNLLGGTITGGSSEHVGGNVYSTGNMTIKDTVITGGQAVNLGGNIYCAGNLTMEKVTVTGGSAKRGGNIYNTGNMTAVGCTVTGGTATEMGVDLMHNAANTTVMLDGSKINNMTIGNGTTSVVVDGTCTVYRMDLTSGAKITLGEELNKNTRIYVTATGVFTEPNDKAGEYVTCFGKANDVPADNAVKLSGNVLMMAHNRANAPECPHCNQPVDWMPWSGGTVPAGHYYLTGDYTTTTSATITDKTGVVLDLNGKLYNATASRTFFVNGGYLALVDTVGSGVVKGNNQLSAGKGGIANVIGGKFELYGGTLIPTAAVQNGTAFYISNSADGATRSQFAIYGGTIDCSALTGVTGTDAALHIKGSDFTMTGGTIKAETAMYVGANVVSAISGGAFRGEVQVTTQTNMTLSGAPIMDRLRLSTDVKLTLGELTDGADIAVDATGAFTVANTNAKTYLDKEYIKSVDEEAIITEKDGVLSMAVKPCAHCGKAEAECNWTQLTATSGALTSGHYYLGTNGLELSGSLTVAAGQDVVIDLRGKTLESKNSRCFDVQGDLTILDTVSGGQMKGKRTGSTLNKGNIAIVNGGTFTMYGGTAIPATAMPYGSAFYVTGGAKLHLKGGTIDCSALTTANSTSGAVYVNTDSSFEMNGGSVLGAPAASGGGVFVNAGSFKMTGGTITGGQVTNMGGGVFTMGASTVELLGGTISGNTADTSGNDVTIGSGGTVTVAGKMVIGEISGKLTLGELKEGSSIGIYTEGVVSNASTNAEAYVKAGYFYSTKPAKVIVHENNTLKAVAYVCPHCGKSDVEWTVWAPVNNAIAAGHYYLDADVNMAANVAITDKINGVVLDLNGHTISGTARTFYVNGGWLTLVDTARGGKVVGGTMTSKGGVANVIGGKLDIYGGTIVPTKAIDLGSAFYVTNPGEVNIYGGTIDGSALTTANSVSSLIYLKDNTKLTVSGGTLKGSASTLGGVVYATNAVIEISDGTFEGANVTTGGGCIYANQSTVTITGGVFTGGTVNGVATRNSGVEIDSTCTISVSGNPQISALYLNSGVKMQIGEMTDGANIDVAAMDAQISEKNDNVQNYVDSKFFEALEAGKKLVSDEGVLTLEDE